MILAPSRCGFIAVEKMTTEAATGWRECGRRARSLCGSNRTIRSGTGDQIGRLRSRRSEVTREALPKTLLGNGWRRDGGGLCGDPPWKRD
ncbi:hypothetical protein TIFTF001_020139 [Ficus carica]|uniref:Uncharacterized protein n=1 Tax=Ficus carica TaxID=3494 RepID=A0AA88A7Y6_FICCA|nr:hypothetical protein TIFTF001_020139 [Ficus carica]